MPSSDPWAVLPRHSARCICRRCRDARRRAEFDSWREYREVERVFSDEAAAYIHQLVRLGWRQKEIAAAADGEHGEGARRADRVDDPRRDPGRPAGAVAAVKIGGDRGQLARPDSLPGCGSDASLTASRERVSPSMYLRVEPGPVEQPERRQTAEEPRTRPRARAH